MRSRSLLLILLLFTLIVTGCPFSSDPKDHRSPPPLPPDHILKKLEAAYMSRDAAAYDSLFYDAEANHDTSTAFVFRFWEEDVLEQRVPDATWNREREVLAARRLFEADSVKSIDLDLTFRKEEPVNIAGHEGEKEIIVDDVHLAIVVADSLMPEPNTYVVWGQRAIFRIKPQWISAEDDTMWRIIYWEDRGRSPEKRAAVMPVSWGYLKSELGD